MDVEKVTEARRDELEFTDVLGVLEESSWGKVLEKASEPPVKTKWVDTKNGNEDNMVIRHRLMAEDTSGFSHSSRPKREGKVQG